MADLSMPEIPGSDDVAAGAARLERALSASLLMPKEVAVVRTVFASLMSADAAMRRPSTGDDHATGCGVLVSVLDSYRRTLSQFGELSR